MNCPECGRKIIYDFFLGMHLICSHDYNLDAVRKIVRGNRKGLSGGEIKLDFSEFICDTLEEGPLLIKELRYRIRKKYSLSGDIVRDFLSELVGKGFILRRGTGRKRWYFLPKHEAMYRRRICVDLLKVIPKTLEERPLWFGALKDKIKEKYFVSTTSICRCLSRLVRKEIIVKEKIGRKRWYFLPKHKETYFIGAQIHPGLLEIVPKILEERPLWFGELAHRIRKKYSINADTIRRYISRLVQKGVILTEEIGRKRWYFLPKHKGMSHLFEVVQPVKCPDFREVYRTVYEEWDKASLGGWIKKELYFLYNTLRKGQAEPYIQHNKLREYPVTYFSESGKIKIDKRYLKLNMGV